MISQTTKLWQFVKDDTFAWRDTQQAWQVEIGGMCHKMPNTNATIGSLIEDLRGLTVKLCGKNHERDLTHFSSCKENKTNMVCGHAAVPFTALREALQLARQNAWCTPEQLAGYRQELDACWKELKVLDEAAADAYGDTEEGETTHPQAREAIVRQERVIARRLLPVRKALVAMLMTYARDAESDGRETLPNA